MLHHAAFETRNPAVREWETWTPALTREQVAVPDIGVVTMHYAVTQADERFVSFETHYDFGNGDIVVAPTTLRLMDQATLGRLADRVLVLVVKHPPPHRSSGAVGKVRHAGIGPVQQHQDRRHARCIRSGGQLTHPVPIGGKAFDRVAPGRVRHGPTHECT